MAILLSCSLELNLHRVTLQIIYRHRFFFFLNHPALFLDIILFIFPPIFPQMWVPQHTLPLVSPARYICCDIKCCHACNVILHASKIMTCSLVTLAANTAETVILQGQSSATVWIINVTESLSWNYGSFHTATSLLQRRSRNKVTSSSRGSGRTTLKEEKNIRVNSWDCKEAWITDGYRGHP